MKLTIDINKIKGQLNPVWNMGFNTCHAPLILREDLNKQINEAASLGFKYIRFHDIFSREIELYNEDENGKPVYNFEKFDSIFDRIIAAGLLPFFEISFCPEPMKKTEALICFYKANTSIPKSYELWNGLIKEVIQHLIWRYGINCVKQWYFEVWNEPDLIFFDGEMEDYFELYDNTVLSIKEVCSELRVGGPATSKCAWIDEFIRHVEEGSELTDYKRVPCDFISTHAYPSDIAFVDSAAGEVELQESTLLLKLFKAVKDKIDKSSLKGTPLIMGEWNSSAGPLAFNHDEKNNGAFIVKTMDSLRNIIDGSLYWNLSDIYEECNFHYTPFHGGYGILNVNSIPKSSYNAFRLLNELNGDELEYELENNKDNCGIIATYCRDKGKIYILLYNYTEPGDDNPQAGKYNIVLKGISNSRISYKSWGINDNSGSPYEWWKAIGAPEFLNFEQMNYLITKSKMEEKQMLLSRDNNSENFMFSEDILPGDVTLIQISNT
jgi:xylan 1,4-beta-xylosidase